jgi:hypothetical protein
MRSTRQTALPSLLTLAALTTSSAAQGRVVYVEGPGTTDAERIALQMLNDAGSRVIDRITWDNPYAEAYGEYLDELQASERARIDAAIEYASRLSEESEDRERTARYIAAREAEQAAKELEDLAWERQKAQWEAERSRMDAVVIGYLSTTEPLMGLAGALRADRGQLAGYEFGYDGRWKEDELRRELYTEAALRGEVLGLIGLALVENSAKFNLGRLLQSTLELDDPAARLRELRPRRVPVHRRLVHRPGLAPRAATRLGPRGRLARGARSEMARLRSQRPPDRCGAAGLRDGPESGARRAVRQGDGAPVAPHAARQQPRARPSLRLRLRRGRGPAPRPLPLALEVRR